MCRVWGLDPYDHIPRIHDCSTDWGEPTSNRIDLFENEWKKKSILFLEKGPLKKNLFEFVRSCRSELFQIRRRVSEISSKHRCVDDGILSYFFFSGRKSFERKTCVCVPTTTTVYEYNTYNIYMYKPKPERNNCGYKNVVLLGVFLFVFYVFCSRREEKYV